MPEETARELLKAAHYEPLGPYPGTARQHWPSRCLLCDARVAVRPTNAKAGRTGCSHPTDHLLAAPPDPRGAQAHLWDDSEAAALAVLDKAQYTPCEPYPGPLEQWVVRCRLCGLLLWAVMHTVRLANERIVGERRSSCAHRWNTLWRPADHELARLFPTAQKD
jgi:hypothetical protein